MKNLILILMLLTTTVVFGQFPAYQNGIEIGKYFQNTEGEFFVHVYETNEYIRVYPDGNGGFATVKSTNTRQIYSNPNKKIVKNTRNNYSRSYQKPITQTRQRTGDGGRFWTIFALIMANNYLYGNRGYGYGFGHGGYGFGGNYFGNHVGQYYYGVGHSKNYPAHGYLWGR